MPRHTVSHTAESSDASPASSLKHSHSKREKVRQFLRRVSSIGHRNSKYGSDQSLSQSFSAGQTQASGSERRSPSPVPHALIDLTVEPTEPAKVPRRGSTSSSVLRHDAGRLTADDGSSFHSSAPSESSASDLPSLTSAHNKAASTSSQPPAEATSAEEPTPEASPDQRDSADAAVQDAPLEVEANPVPPVFLADHAEAELATETNTPTHVIPASEDTPVASPSQQDAPAPAAPAQLDGSYVEVNPFDDAYAADTESHGSASPPLDPVAVDNTDVAEITLSQPDEGPLAVSPAVEVSESRERTVEVTLADETLVSATAEVAPTPTVEVTPTDAPYVVIVAPSPTAPPAPAAPSLSLSPSLYPAPAHPALALSPSPSPVRTTPAPAPLVALLQKLRAFVPLPVTRKTGLRWRTPLAYGLVVACYSLTWWLNRRPPVEVPVGFFQMY